MSQSQEEVEAELEKAKEDMNVFGTGAVMQDSAGDVRHIPIQSLTLFHRQPIEIDIMGKDPGKKAIDSILQEMKRRGKLE